jgi:hypothetical protein
MPTNPGKKVVRVEPAASQPSGQAWKATPEAKGQATTSRIIALILWLLAMGGEAFAIFYVLKQSTINMVLLVGAIVVIGVLAVIGDLLWKRANRLDPASTSEPVRFFIQNQLGAILALLAFLPLIVMIFLNKNMNTQQKGIAGGIGVVVLLIAAFMGVSINPPSVEQYTQQTAVPQFPAESAVVIGYTGKDFVYWTKDGTVYHLCQSASDLQRTSKDNTIYSGSVADAHAAGMGRLTLQVSEEIKQCGLPTPAAPIAPAAPAASPTR